VILLHFSVFYDEMGRLSPEYLNFIERNQASYLTAMFQDEQAYLEKRLEFCRDYGVDCVFTMFEQETAERIYGQQTAASEVVSALPGYVSDGLREVGARLTIADRDRPVDIGYRGRKPPIEWGPEAQEKYEIAHEFARHAVGLELRLDIETDESKRMYGESWYRFMAACRATLGTESGTVIRRPTAHGDELLPYRTISPRHLEAAAFRSCQILYEGRYSGALEPMTHYIPLRKDFSNFDEVIARFKDPDIRSELTANAYRDLIEDDRYSYKGFVAGFDRLLVNAGIEPSNRTSAGGRLRMASVVYSPRPRRRGRLWLSRIRSWTRR
jgi:hypothetical protein